MRAGTSISDGERLLRAMVLLAAAVTAIALATSGVESVVEAWTGRSDAAIVRRRLTCLEREVRAALPPGAAVVINEDDEGEYQRLAEFVSSRGTVVAPEDAQFAVSMVPADRGSRCDVLSVRVSRR